MSFMTVVEGIFWDEDRQVLWLRLFFIFLALLVILPFMVHRPGTRRKRLYRRFILSSGRKYNNYAAQNIASFLDEVRQACLVSGQKLTIVEVGPGPFPSLKAYPPGVRLICIEPCNEFNRYIEHEWKKSHLASKRESLEEHSRQSNGALSTSSSSSSLSIVETPLSETEEVEDENKPESQLLIYNVPAERMVEVVGVKSADIVVGRQLLCSVDDVANVVDQICTVLKPGGQYFFYEHVRSKSRFVRIFQTLLAYPPFSYLTGCDLRRKNYFSQTAPGFSRFEYKSFSASLPWYMFPYARTVTGCGVK